MSEFIDALMQKMPGVLRIEELKAQIGVKSQRTVYEKVRSGTLTQPVRIGERSVAWPAYEVAAINTARAAGFSDEELRNLIDQLHAKRKQLRALIAGPTA